MCLRVSLAHKFIPTVIGGSMVRMFVRTSSSGDIGRFRTFLLLVLIFQLPHFGGTEGSCQSPGDTLFGSSHVHNINITFAQPNFWDSLMYYKQHADSFNLSTSSMLGDIYFDGTLIDSVGVKLKGNSSFGFPGRKKPIKVSFNQYVKGKKLEGLTTIDLNNNMLDPTMMREKLLLDFMNKKGLPAPRCTYARVSYNGQYVGLYKMVEPIDKAFIKTHFGEWKGNLFKGDPQGTLNWIDNNPASYYPYYELHSNNTPNNWIDVVNLIDNINNTPSANFYDTLEGNLNTAPCIQQWAARNLFVDLDGYFHAPHNYYLYHDSLSNKFEWITWDVSVSFGFYPYWKEDSTEHISLLHANGILAQRMLSNPIYKTAYLNSICDYLDYLDTAVMNPMIDSIANRIYPDFVAEPDSNQMFPEQALFWTCDTMTIHTPIGDIPGLKRFIVNRRNNVLAELASLPFICTNGINENESLDEILVYPNPSRGKFEVKSQKSKINRLEIYNVMGECIYQLPDSPIPQFPVINLSSQPQGIYFLKAETKSEIRTVRITVIR